MLIVFALSNLVIANPYSDHELRRAVPADTQILQLQDSSGQFPALLQAAVKAEPLGGILVLTDTESQQQWLDQSHAIRIHLAEHGWLTITLPLPLTPVHSDGLTTEALALVHSQHQEQVIARIEAGLDQFEPERLLILAMGRSAEWASLIMQDTDRSIRLIMVNPRPTDDQQPLRFLERLSTLEATVIDLYKEPYAAGKKAIPDARMRRNAMIQAGMTDYHAQMIKEAIWGSELEILKRQIRGVINTYIIAADEEREKQIRPPEVDERPPGARR